VRFILLVLRSNRMQLMADGLEFKQNELRVFASLMVTLMLPCHATVDSSWICTEIRPESVKINIKHVVLCDVLKEIQIHSEFTDLFLSCIYSFSLLNIIVVFCMLVDEKFQSYFSSHKNSFLASYQLFPPSFISACMWPDPLLLFNPIGLFPLSGNSAVLLGNLALSVPFCFITLSLFYLY
jgi:hypothetical protein